MPGYQYNGSAEVRLKVRLLGDVSSLSLVSLELVVTPLIMNCQADHSRHIFCYVLHDVDMVPETDLAAYHCPPPGQATSTNINLIQSDHITLD